MDTEYKPKNIREMVRDPLLRESFLSFLMDELAVENYTFWEEVEAYKGMMDDVIRTRRFFEIYDKYFSPESLSELSMAGDDRLRVDKAFATLSRSSCFSSVASTSPSFSYSPSSSFSSSPPSGSSTSSDASRFSSHSQSSFAPIPSSLSSSSPAAAFATKDVFDRIQRRVYAELSTELFYRFLRSEHYARFLEDREDPDGSKRRREKLEDFFGMTISGPLHRKELLVYVKKKGFFWYRKGRVDLMPQSSANLIEDLNKE